MMQQSRDQPKRIRRRNASPQWLTQLNEAMWRVQSPDSLGQWWSMVEETTWRKALESPW